MPVSGLLYTLTGVIRIEPVVFVYQHQEDLNIDLLTQHIILTLWVLV